MERRSKIYSRPKL